MRFLSLLLLGFLSVGSAHASPPPGLCDAAIVSAEYLAHLPPRMLQAIAQVESGRFDDAAGAARPWPWTINAEGQGHFYETKAQAIAAVQALQARGVRSIDVGCAQINLMFHPDAFKSLDEAFDPIANARYAARFLNQLHGPGKDWAYAIGAYHSETPALGDAYRVLVMLRWKNPNIGVSGTRMAVYAAFQPAQSSYRAFAQALSAYGAFAPR
jgi:soluble lytic murein transglycosylase-like protein